MSSGSESSVQNQNLSFQPVENTQLDSSYGATPTAVPQTFTEQGMPTWMRPSQTAQPNWFAADWWGKSAADPTQSLTQEDLMYQAPATTSKAPAEAVAAAVAEEAEPDAWGQAMLKNLVRMDAFDGENSTGRAERFYLSNPDLNLDYDPRRTVEEYYNGDWSTR